VYENAEKVINYFYFYLN